MLLAALAALAAVGIAHPPGDAAAASFCGASGWHITWRDEFDGASLDESKWNVQLSGGAPLAGDGDAQAPLAADGDARADCHGRGCSELGSCRTAACTRDNVYVRDGRLVLRTRRVAPPTTRDGGELVVQQPAPPPPHNVTTGAVNSWGKGSWSSADVPGAGTFRLCISARLPGSEAAGAASGLWPAHWMMPQDDSCDPDEGEMDIMEMVDGDGTSYSTYHWQDDYPTYKCSFPKNHSHVYSQVELGKGWNGTFHEFAVERGPAHVAFAVDGKVTLNSSGASPEPRFWNGSPWYLILNTAVGGSWPGPATAETELPAEHEVDYVRVARRK